MHNFAIIFDMDGVIVDSNPFHFKALDVFFQKYNFHPSEEALNNHIYGRANKDWIPYLFGNISEQE